MTDPPIRIEVPARKRKRAAHAHRVQPAGKWRASVAGVEPVPGGFEVSWRFRAEGRAWTIGQELDAADLGELLVDLGLAGRTVGLDEIVGRAAVIHVATYGGRSHARVRDVTPLPA